MDKRPIRALNIKVRRIQNPSQEVYKFRLTANCAQGSTILLNILKPFPKQLYQLLSDRMVS